MTAFLVIACILVGLAVGSFLNVVIWRVPQKESVATPSSHCPECDVHIAPRDNVPLLSWLLLRGRCRECSAPIPARYPLVEVGCAVLWGAVAARFSDSAALPAYLVLAAALLALSVIDLERYILPDRIVFPTLALGVVLLGVAAIAEGDLGAFGRALLGGLAAFGAMLLLHLVAPRGMGFGDVKLSLVLGLYLGWLGWRELFLAYFACFLLGALVGVALIVLGLRSRKDHVPFGPFLAAGTLLVVLWGGSILDWYSRHR